MRIVFCGTPSFAVPTLKHLLAQPDIEIVGVITQPDRPRGRGQDVSFSAVKEAALAAKLAVHQPGKIRAPETETLLRKLAPDGVVIIEFPTVQAAKDWYHSPAYQEIIGERLGATVGRSVIVEGFSPG